MNIAYVCVSHKPISIETTGGIETFTIYLLNALINLGHNVTLFAAKETDLTAFSPKLKFVPIFSLADLGKKESENLESKEFTLNYAFFQYAGVAKVLIEKETFDIIHYSCAQWYAPFLLSDGKTKTLTTIHVNNLRPSAISYLFNNFPNNYIANISDSSSMSFQSYPKRKTVYNGIDLEYFPYHNSPDDYYAWLGRIAPVKGLKEALQAAKIADVSLQASGPLDFMEYYNKDVKPLLDAKRKLIRPLNFREKGMFLGKAKAVLMPVNWEEPFGLVAIEAMACGTPVIAFARGGLKETVVDGKTGYLVNSVEEMAEKIKQIDKIDRKKCREHVEKNFSSQVMAEKYAEYYQEIQKIS
ncbi:MAG: Glycosyltransferase [Candidatus Daviesbacteria bacterium GW2011_GWB1_41_5]|uniref:Glycosyltransferase n=1 Tax=Candidatus Daviesbacteria bacterium GW2011_GWB1_41_5 TaxID=1618429 RepID=A0A0G0WE11_9BACT|nr:MAG: Glycosyltransferase [Candidatus Daviesbacteria bacterium GW2011_GWB1_41_5]